MNGNDETTPAPAEGVDGTIRRSRRARLAALVAGGLAAGGLLMGAANASASTDTTSSSSSSSSTSGTSAAAPAAGQGRSDETVVTGTRADTLRAAALKAVPGGTVDRVETDAGDAAYEVHMTKSDGTRVTVKFDDALALVKVEDGMGQGDPAPAGAPAQPGSAPAPSA